MAVLSQMLIINQSMAVLSQMLIINQPMAVLLQMLITNHSMAQGASGLCLEATFLKEI